MKKRFSSRLSALMLALLMLPLSACSSGSDDVQTGASVTSAADTTEVVTETTETGRADVKDNLPADLNLGGETINILGRNADNIMKFDIVGTDNSGEIVYDAVWERNARVKERLNVELNVIPSQSTSLNDLKKEMQQTVMAGAGDFDLFITSNNSIVQFGMVAYLRSFNNAPYLDFEQPWWWTESMLDISLDGKTIQYLIGDILPFNLLTSAVIYANKDIWQDHFGDPDQMYDMVENGEWTLDKFAQYSRDVYEDANGNGILDKDDVVGFYGNEYQSIDYLAAGSDLFFCVRGEDGTVSLNPPDERAVDFVELLINLFYNETTAIITPGSVESELVPAFAQGRCLFIPNILLVSTQAAMRDMESDFAILPIPKYDENQKQYKTDVYGHSTNASVPVTVDDAKFESVCAVLEALCAESYRSVTEKLYEVALKGKYARDARSAQMLDLILSCTCKDFANEYANRLAYVNNTFHTAISQKNAAVVSTYQTVAKKAQSGLDSLLKELEKVQ